MLDFCIDTITSDRLTLSSPMVKRLPKSADAVCEALTESSAPFRASAKLTLAAGISVWIIGTLASGRVAADFSCAIIASILLLSIPPVFTLPPACFPMMLYVLLLENKTLTSKATPGTMTHTTCCQGYTIPASKPAARPSRRRKRLLFGRLKRVTVADNPHYRPLLTRGGNPPTSKYQRPESNHGCSGRHRTEPTTTGAGTCPHACGVRASLRQDADGQEFPARPGRGGSDRHRRGPVYVEPAA